MFLSDKEIWDLCRAEHMIEPFEPKISTRGGVSYGLSSYGYDVRLGRDFKVYAGAGLIEPANLQEYDIISLEDQDSYVLRPGGFVLAHTVEYLRMPRDITGLVKDKSTYARCGITLQTTVLEAGWEGQVTLEIFNNNHRPVRLCAGHGIAQIMFVRGNPCMVSYADRRGKYQGQTGVTMPRNGETDA